jgi:hypothetical protein
VVVVFEVFVVAPLVEILYLPPMAVAYEEHLMKNHILNKKRH